MPKAKKTTKSTMNPPGNITDRVIEAIQNHLRTTGTEAKKIIFSPDAVAELHSLQREEIGGLAEKVWQEGLPAFNGHFLGRPFEIRDDCEDIRIE